MVFARLQHWAFLLITQTNQWHMLLLITLVGVGEGVVVHTIVEECVVAHLGGA